MQEPGEALAVLESIQNDQREFGHLLHLAECHRGMGNHDEAQRFLLVANNSVPESLSPRDRAAFEELRRAYPASDSIGATP